MSIGPTFSFAVVLFVHVVAYSVYPRAAQAQIVMQVTSEPVLAPAISAYSPDVPAKDRTEIRDALLTFPFQLPERMSARVARGDTTALLVVAVEAIRATHVPRSFPLAKAYFEQAAARSDPRGVLAMAVLYANGWGVGRDLRVAREQLTRLIAVQYPRAYCVQAELDSRLPGGKGNNKIRDSFLAGASRGDAYCQNLLGISYEQDGIIPQALEWYRRAAAQGNPAAIQNLVRLDTKAFSAFEQSFKALKQAADRGDPISQFEMGRRYHRGIGVPVDFQQALLWYKKAAERNDAARFLVAAVLEGSAKASPGEIDAPTMYRIAALPLIESVSNAPVRAPVVRDHDQLADLEGLPLEPFAQRLRDALAARTGVATGATDVVPASAAPPALIDTKVVLGVPGAAGGTSVTSAAIPLPVISSTIKPGQAGPTPFPSQFSHDAP